MSDLEQTQGEPKQEERSLGLACHLLALAGLVVPFGNILGPLIMWLVKKDQSSFVDDRGKEALNFQISLILYLIASAVLIIVLIGILLIIVVGVAGIVLTIIAAVRASEGEEYRYPMTIRLVK